MTEEETPAEPKEEICLPCEANTLQFIKESFCVMADNYQKCVTDATELTKDYLRGKIPEETYSEGMKVLMKREFGSDEDDREQSKTEGSQTD